MTYPIAVPPALIRALGLILASLAIGALAAPGMVLAQTGTAPPMERFDPDEAFRSAPESGAIDGDLTAPQGAPPPIERDQPYTAPDATQGVDSWREEDFAAPAPPPAAAADQASASTYAEDDLIGAAEGVFGKGAEGLAKMIEGLLAKQGQPNGYIVGREAGGAFILGARYGSGTLHHKIEGERQVYWTGPSVGFDAGANAANTFVLVYNLYDSEDLFSRFPAGEGQAYFVGGLHASYLRKGDIVLIPIRMGAGLRLGINAGYMRFSQKQRWLPF
ncbi:MAG: DUF1134 domain-containing protein [Erythrobacter sp.]